MQKSARFGVRIGRKSEIRVTEPDSREEVVYVPPPPPAGDPDSIPVDRRRFITKCGSHEQCRKIDSGIYRQLERAPEPSIHLHQVVAT